jgi:hypothetical protein
MLLPDFQAEVRYMAVPSEVLARQLTEEFERRARPGAVLDPRARDGHRGTSTEVLTNSADGKLIWMPIKTPTIK